MSFSHLFIPTKRYACLPFSHHQKQTCIILKRKDTKEFRDNIEYEKQIDILLNYYMLCRYSLSYFSKISVSVI